MNINVLIVCLLISTMCSAQKNSIGVTLNSLSFLNQKYRTSDLSNIGNQKSLQILPSLHYARNIKNKVWIGLDAAYQSFTYEMDQYLSTPLADYYYKSTNQLPYKSVYICPAISELINFENYLVIPAVTIPLEYVFYRKQYHDNTLIDRNTLTILEETYTTENWPKILNLGVFLNLGIYREVWRKFYFGGQIGVGVPIEIYLGNGSYTVTKIENGVKVAEESYSKHYVPYITTDNSFTGREYLAFRTTLSLKYLW